MTRYTALFALLLAAAPLTGCLESGRTNGTTDTMTTDTSTSTDTSVSQDTLVSQDTTTWIDVTDCTAGSCDDGDPCTVDLCDPDTGLCQHYQAPSGGMRAPNECDIDSDCDDGDACSVDECVHVDDGCGYGYAYCTYGWPDGCYGCMETGCDDGDPCTADVCQANGECRYDEIEGCEFGCSGANVTPHAEAMYGPPGQAVKLAGFITPDPMTVCVDYSCECTGAPAVIDDNADAIALHGAAGGLGTDSEWRCSENYCADEAPVCEPVKYSASYWLWGTTEDRYTPYAGAGDPAGAAVPAPPKDVLRVTDYCLQTNAAGLVGHYEGTFTTNAFWDSVFAIEGWIKVSADGQLTLTLAEPDCPTCGQTAISYFFPQTVPVTTGDGWISFEVATPTICNAILPPPDAKLYSHRNTLSGVYHDKLVGAYDGDGTSDELLYCAEGSLSLTRTH